MPSPADRRATADDESPIGGNGQVTSCFPQAVEIRAYVKSSGKEETICSGVLIEGGVATAGHCSDPDFRDYKVVFHASSGEQRFDLPPTAITKNPLLAKCPGRARNNSSERLARDDIGFIAFDASSSGVTPAVLGSIDTGLFGTVVGYGSTGEGSTGVFDSQRRRADITITNQANSTMTGVGGSTGTTCGGDSGGPLFVGNDCPGEQDAPVVTGLVSRSTFCGTPAMPVTTPQKTWFAPVGPGSGGHEFLTREGTIGAGFVPECCPFQTQRCGGTGSRRCGADGKWEACCGGRSEFSGEAEGEGEGCSLIRCGDAACSEGEDYETCPEDCPYVCDADTCPAVCGNGVIESGEACDGAIGCNSGEYCSPDCGQCVRPCGNGSCEAGEDCLSCPSDCGNCYCGNGVCDSAAGESMSTCCQDCGCPSRYQCDYANRVCYCEPEPVFCECPGDVVYNSCGNIHQCEASTGSAGSACCSDDDCQYWLYCNLYFADSGFCEYEF